MTTRRWMVAEAKYQMLRLPNRFLPRFRDRPMRPFWTPRFRICSFLALIAIVAVLLAFIRPNPRGKLRIRQVKHAGDWNIASQAIAK